MLARVAYPDNGDLLTHGPVDVRHGVDGWVLVDMEWDPDSGLAVYDFVQYDDRGRFVATATAVARQPYSAKHEGWSELWNEPEHVFGLY